MLVLLLRQRLAFNVSTIGILGQYCEQVWLVQKNRTVDGDAVAEPKNVFVPSEHASL